MELGKALGIAAHGMDAQSVRLRVIAENLANQDTSGSAPGVAPYRRKTVTFASKLDDESGVSLIDVKKIGHDESDFPLRFDPSNPAADPRGYVKTPNVNSFVEMMDMHEAQRSYSANLAVMQTARGMLARTIEMLK